MQETGIGDTKACWPLLESDDGCCDVDECAETGICLEAMWSGTPVFLQLSEEVLDQVARRVGIAVELDWKAAVGFGRDDCLGPCLGQRLAQLIRVENMIR